jgi:hypothetical protein
MICVYGLRFVIVVVRFRSCGDDRCFVVVGRHCRFCVRDRSCSSDHYFFCRLLGSSLPLRLDPQGFHLSQGF